ncbi:MAG: hypothetical protein MUF23_17025, partial [Pirellula sp.]|nr:hypothetical protein [Pirellula sp.]
ILAGRNPPHPAFSRPGEGTRLRDDARLLAHGTRPTQRIAFSLAVWHSPDMEVGRQSGNDEIDESLLDCFLGLSLKERIQSAAGFANAIEKLRRIRAADDPVEIVVDGTDRRPIAAYDRIQLSADIALARSAA